MTSYVESLARPPRTLTQIERDALLRVTGAHVAGFRDHVLYVLALSSALRETELLALDVGDLLQPAQLDALNRGATDVLLRRRVQLRVWKRGNDHPDAQQVLLGATARVKLARLLVLRRRANGALASAAPVFVSNRGTRLSARRARSAFAAWQVVAGFERRVNFHMLRHSAINDVYRAKRDLRMAQAFGRHASPRSTAIYTHPTDDELLEVINALRV